MIKYNNNTINDWYFYTSDIIKVYRNNAVCYYKVNTSGDTPQYDVCYAVVDDISEYQETEFEDVFNKADEKWYKLNNINQYEQYGIYGSGRNVTTYEGKLTIDDGYEYEWNGSSWVNLGEVSGSSRVPIGYTEVEYVQNSGTSYLNTNFVPNQDTRVVCDMQNDNLTQYPRLWGAGAWNSVTGLDLAYQNDGGAYCLHISWLGSNNWTYFTSFTDDGQRHTHDLNKNYLYRDGTLVGSNTYTTRTASDPIGVFTYIGSGRPSQSGYWGQEHFKGKMYSFQIYDNGTLVRDLVPCKRDNDNTVGAYDIVNDVFYTVPTGYTTDKLIAGAETGTTEYPKYYTEKSEPLDNLTFNTLADAQAYAEANCVYDGMKATIGADRYYFDSSDENGWVKILEYYKFEDVTPNAASGWTITGSSTYNPQPSYYDDFSLETNSTSNSYKIAKVTIFGYDNFTYYLRSFNGWSSSYCYLMASNVDELQSDPISMSYSSNSAVTNTYGFNKTAGSAVNLSNYRRVTYNNLDKTVEHTFYVVFYGRTYSNYASNATILIPKEQTNENWEQVTFSASSNVASAQKNLYIDNNNSTSGGTQYWYYRWMVGLPSGSHSSYVSYSSYDYCPNTTSSTFTSVAGEQRQVNFTYDSTSNKSLQFRLVDTSGNTITPSDTVYYNMTYYNACNASSSSSNVTFPRSQSVKVGGRFRFANSSNRQYIYGYSPNISLNTDYYVDNYSTYFDIPYTKLNTEAVTITYATYDPNDTEIPAFKTDISYPYGSSGTSSTTLTSYGVPYTYSYSVNQTSNMFGATSAQTYTAGQSSRTISFTLYPNNRTFATISDMEAYQYAWEGMNATVDGTKYKYENGSWVEQSYTQYEYIQTQAAKRYDINTNFYPTTAYTIETKFEMNTQSVDWGKIICWASCDGDSCDASQFRFTTVTGSYAIITRLGNTSGTSYKTIGSGKTITVTMPLSATSGTYNSGTTDYSYNYNYNSNWGSNLPSSTAMHIFSLGGSNVSDSRYSACVKMYYIKIYDANHNLVKHYVPSDNNGTPCFYEIVDGEYIMDSYTGSNHGTLTLGPQV